MTLRTKRSSNENEENYTLLSYVQHAKQVNRKVIFEKNENKNHSLSSQAGDEVPKTIGLNQIAQPAVEQSCAHYCSYSPLQVSMVIHGDINCYS